MPFAIVAELPLGTYRGAAGDGRPERIPSLARLHSALLCAAGFGPRAVPGDRKDTLELSEADSLALQWIENNPPDQVHIPELQVNAGRVTAWRDDGTLEKPPVKGTKTKAASDTLRIKKLGKQPDNGTAVNGTFQWIWTENLPPEPVRAVLEQLCPDVAYLGTSESPVRLLATAAGEVDATHRRDRRAGLFTVGATGVTLPLPGRLAELAKAHREMTGQTPPVARDRPTQTEVSQSPIPHREAIETAWYSPVHAPASDVPWPQVIVIPMSEAIPEQRRVAWAVAAHRAMVRALGYGAPAMITGAYPEGVGRPANRIALHFLNPGLKLLSGVAEQPALAILVPGAGVDAADLEALHRAAERMTELYGPRDARRDREIPVRLDVDALRVIDGSRFWAPPEPGMIRLWHTAPPAIPDTRGGRGAQWNFAHAALLSVGFAWKDQLPKASGRGDVYHRNLAVRASEAGVAVVHAAAIRTSDVWRYVHKINEHAVVRPYTAYLSMGSLAGTQTIQAIGQSRHLGGGLLVPFDVPEGVAADEVTAPGGDETWA